MHFLSFTPKCLKTFVILLTIGTVACGSALATDQDTDTGSVLSKLKASATEIVNQATQKNQLLLFRFGAELGLSLDAWEAANSDLLTTRFNTLKKPHQVFLKDIEELLSEVSRVVYAAETIEQLTTDWKKDAGLISLVDELPAVTSYAPAVITPLNTESTLKISFKGKGFKHAPPKLIFDGIEASLISNSDNEISFRLDAETIVFKNKARILNATLLTYRPDKPDEETSGQYELRFKIPFMIMPKHPGNYKVISEYTQTVDHNSTFRNEFRHSSDKPALNCKAFNQRPSLPGRKMKNVRLERAWGENGRERILNANPNGFSIEICVARQNKPYLGNPPGKRNVIYTWDEYWQETENSKSASLGKFEWGKEVLIKLEKNTRDFEVTVNNNTGETIRLNNESSHPFYKLSFDSDANKLRITQQIPASINQL